MVMDQSTAEALRILDEIKRTPIPTGPVRLSPAYLRTVRAAEDLAAQRDHKDKTWVVETIRRSRRLQRLTRLVR